MNAHTRNRRFSFARRSAGFTLIEVMIAILILAIGLLGFALLQTMNVRFTQSANQRTQVTNLASDLLDKMRANRLSAAQYTGATFVAGSRAVAPCGRPTNTVSVAQNIDRWQCQVVKSLGQSAGATVTYANGVAVVTIVWGDERWSTTGNPDTILAVSTRL